MSPRSPEIWLYLVGKVYMAVNWWFQLQKKISIVGREKGSYRISGRMRQRPKILSSYKFSVLHCLLPKLNSPMKSLTLLTLYRGCNPTYTDQMVLIRREIPWKHFNCFKTRFSRKSYRWLRAEDYILGGE